MVGAASPSIEPRRGRSRSTDLARAIGAVLLGLCLHTFHTCGSGADGGHELRDAHPLTGRCGGGAGDEHELLEFALLMVERCVWGYFLTIMACWFVFFSALEAMISKYLDVLVEVAPIVARNLTAWPNTAVLTVALAVAMLGAALILDVVLRHRPLALSARPRMGGSAAGRRAPPPRPKRRPKSPPREHVSLGVGRGDEDISIARDAGPALDRAFNIIEDTYGVLDRDNLPLDVKRDLLYRLDDDVAGGIITSLYNKIEERGSMKPPPGWLLAWISWLEEQIGIAKRLTTSRN